ncbi:MAG: M50 family metallopeptidase [Halanaerobiales bacterium]
MTYLKINPLFILALILFSFCGLFIEALVAFSFVLLHELIHVFIANYLGYKLKKLELFPFGGMVEFDKLLEMEPVNEIKIAISGPIFNIFLAAVFFIFFKNNEFMGILIKYNLIIGLFNLLPVLPLDGGRILRGFLVKVYGLAEGGKLAFRVAKFFSILGIIIGIYCIFVLNSNLMILLVSFFVYLAIIKERERLFYNILNYMTNRRKYLKRLETSPVSLRVINYDHYLRDLPGLLIPGKFNVFYVLNKNLELKTVLTEIKIIDRYLSDTDKNLRIKDIIF